MKIMTEKEMAERLLNIMLMFHGQPGQSYELTKWLKKKENMNQSEWIKFRKWFKKYNIPIM